MGKLIIEKLDHEILENTFSCGNKSIDSQIKESYFPTLLQYAYAYQVSLDNTVVGYYMIGLRSIKMDFVPEEIQEYKTSLVNSVGALHIPYIAVSEKYQNRNIGTYVLRAIMLQVKNLCKIVPIAVMTLDALKEKYEWYKKRGFKPFDEKELVNEDSIIRMYVNCILDMEAVENYGKA